MAAHPIATDACALRRACLDIDDRDLMFSAVNERLRELANAPAAADSALARMQAGVLDCVLALERLQADLRLETALRQRLDDSGIAA